MTDNIFGVQAKALLLSEKRADLLAKNMANASTPNYKAQDFDFKAAMKNEQALKLIEHPLSAGHLAINEGKNGIDIHTQAGPNNSYDGNTVDKDVERVKFMENALTYQTSISFIKSRASSIITAIKGE